MKKVLILTTSTGQGHNQAANSLVEAFTRRNYTCVKHDFLDGNSKFFNDLIVQGYEVLASKLPKIYGVSYIISNTKFVSTLSPLVFLGTIKKLKMLINEEKPDLIIGTHPFTVNIISIIKKDGFNIPFISVVTDFKAHYSYINKRVDAYVTGSDFTKNSLINRGIDKNKIYSYGIPIKENFYLKEDNIQHIKDDEYFSLLLMSGSMGLKNISYVLDELLTNSNNLRITVVCGNNKILKESLDKKANNNYINKKLHILGFSNDISSLMEYSDVLISKPGGLTVSEAIIKNLPLIIPFAIPGQEYENTEFLTSSNYAFSVKDIKDINPLINKLIENPSILQNAKNKIKELSSTYSINKTIELGEMLINKYKNK